MADASTQATAPDSAPAPKQVKVSGPAEEDDGFTSDMDSTPTPSASPGSLGSLDSLDQISEPESWQSGASGEFGFGASTPDNPAPPLILNGPIPEDWSPSGPVRYIAPTTAHPRIGFGSLAEPPRWVIAEVSEDEATSQHQDVPATGSSTPSHAQPFTELTWSFEPGEPRSRGSYTEEQLHDHAYRLLEQALGNILIRERLRAQIIDPTSPSALTAAEQAAAGLEDPLPPLPFPPPPRTDIPHPMITLPPRTRKNNSLNDATHRFPDYQRPQVAPWERIYDRRKRKTRDFDPLVNRLLTRLKGNRFGRPPLGDDPGNANQGRPDGSRESSEENDDDDDEEDDDDGDVDAGDDDDGDDDDDDDNTTKKSKKIKVKLKITGPAKKTTKSSAESDSDSDSDTEDTGNKTSGKKTSGKKTTGKKTTGKTTTGKTTTKRKRTPGKKSTTKQADENTTDSHGRDISPTGPPTKKSKTSKAKNADKDDNDGSN